MWLDHLTTICRWLAKRNQHEILNVASAEYLENLAIQRTLQGVRFAAEQHQPALIPSADHPRAVPIARQITIVRKRLGLAAMDCKWTKIVMPDEIPAADERYLEIRAILTTLKSVAEAEKAPRP